MIVSEAKFPDVIKLLKEESVIFLDTETTGLRPYHGDRLFSFAVCGLSSDRGFYFDFSANPNAVFLPESYLIYFAKELFTNDRTVVNHNLKFDMHMLGVEGIDIQARLEDTWFLQRLSNNSRSCKYSLDALSKEILGFGKSTDLEEYCKKHKLYEKIVHHEYGFEDKKPKYYEVPQDIVAEYAIKDVLLTKKLWVDAWTKITEYDSSTPKIRKKLAQVVEIESKLLPVVYEMEKTGVKINRSYCLEAIKFYTTEIRKIEWEFKEQTGEIFQKSPLLFKEIFKDEKWKFTEKNNPSFTAKVLETFEHPVAKLVTKYDALKKNLDYFQTFDYYADKFDVIRPNMMSAGTKTGRFSCSDPNLQNLTRPDKYEGNVEAEMYPVRGAFQPREGCFFWAADYDQMELKMMADRAGAYSIARKILKEGLDFHNATALLASVTRSQAKTVNFAVTYGSGLDLLAKQLKTTVDEAKRIKSKIFEAIPEVPRFMRELSKTAEDRGYIFSWSGRVLRFPDKDKSYKALNHYVQGGCADVVKLAMIECASFIKRNNLKTRIVLQVHDELVFEVPFNEEPYLGNFLRIMQGIYEHDILPLTASAKIARKNLAEKADWIH